MNNLSQWAIKKEIILRGACLQLAVDAEWIMVMIIDECFKNDRKEVGTFYQYNNGKSKGIKDLTFEEVIEVCREGIKRYKPELVVNSSAFFDEIDKIRKVRNRYAHHKMDTVFCKQDGTELTFHTMRNNKFKVESNIYNVNYLTNELIEFSESLKKSIEILGEVFPHLKNQTN